MATNKYDLDTAYIGKNLKILQRDIEQYTPQEMRTALNKLADTCHNFAKCGRCSGYNTSTMRHDAAHWFCYDCAEKYPLKAL